MVLTGFNSKLLLTLLAWAFTSALSPFDDWPHLRNDYTVTVKGNCCAGVSSIPPDGDYQ
ncbi:hypothetical protein VSDG_02296 [Cytospora chrysosperma]|uniref:Uncharacterized protein n=1 Tax=Cytospora chrysosperma TaxID=252740 RepID=A0A423WEN6_CYTCH|nr:hypothetical protein VSDG_02296 [Valsa sordida]